MNKEDLSREWFEIAAEDYRSATQLDEHEPKSYRSICYHCEQAVEKALKGYLVYCGVDSVPRTHDLGELCRSCAFYEPKFAQYLEDCTELTLFSTQIRYPSSMAVEAEDSDFALASAKRITDFVMTSIAMEQYETAEQDQNMEQTMQ